jgi:CRP-like cAMP-binding protein
MQQEQELEPLIRKLSLLHDLDAEDRAALEGLDHRVTHRVAGSFLIDEGTRPTCFFVLLDGFAYRSKSLPDGRVQIVSFHMPGDLFDLRQLFDGRVDTNVVTLGPARVAEIPVNQLRDLKSSRPNIADALWRDTMLDGAIYREWVVNVGQRDARARIAHMLAEFAQRLEAAIPGASQSFVVPMTQQQISAATGLSAVHVNRIVKQLALDGIFTKRGGRLVVGHPQALKEVASFEPSYLGPLAGFRVDETAGSA